MRRLAALLFVVLAGLASPAPARAGLTDADYWAFADRQMGGLDERWSVRLHEYVGKSGEAEIRENAALLMTHAIAAYTGHSGPTRQDGRLRIAYKLTSSYEKVRKVTLIRLDAILYGVIATYACRRWVIGIGIRRALAAGGLAVTAVAIWMLASGRVNADPWMRAAFFSVMPLGLAATLPLPAAATGRRVPAPVRNVVRVGALWSYSLYLCNLPVQRIMIWRDIGGTTVLGCAAASVGFLAVAIAWAAANYAAVERPIMRARERVAARLGLVSPVAAGETAVGT